MQTQAVLLTSAQQLSLQPLRLTPPKAGDVVVRIDHSAISTGTESLFWNGTMPPFPGMGYPLVPGYEAAGEVVECAADVNLRAGDTVFVPGANCYEEAHGLFGGSSRYVVTPAQRVLKVDAAMGEEAALFALAATARHAIASPQARLPDLIVGAGALGRLLTRLTIAAGHPAPTVWDTDADRQDLGDGLTAIHPDDDHRRDYTSIYDASGDAAVLDQLMMRLTKGGAITLCGFYPDRVNFAFAPAFMKEARLRIAAEWTHGDLEAVRALIDRGSLRLNHLITHRMAAQNAADAYNTAFSDRSCLKMALDWKDVA